jgi:hypothetical protein
MHGTLRQRLRLDELEEAARALHQELGFDYAFAAEIDHRMSFYGISYNMIKYRTWTGSPATDVIDTPHVPLTCSGYCSPCNLVR